jgi:hypothetical protein
MGRMNKIFNLLDRLIAINDLISILERLVEFANSLPAMATPPHLKLFSPSRQPVSSRDLEGLRQRVKGLSR